MDFKRKKRSRVTLPEVSLTPLIDTALTLLIIFMITTPMLQDAIKVSLPETKNPHGTQPKQPEQLIISIDKKGRIFLDNAETALKDISYKLQKKIGKTRDNIVVVKGDRDLVYDKIVQVVDEIQGVEGIKHVALAAKRRA